MSTGLSFLKNKESKNSKNKDKFWKVIIADDDDEVHKVTRVVLGKESFDGKRIQLISAYSAKETKEVMKENSDAAVILLDVVMEEDDSGLKLIRYIRDEMKNSRMRIILRTGQPGQAPEDSVIREYDINDYKEKTELTSQKLITAVLAAIRSYRDIDIIERNKEGLEKILTVSSEILKNNTTKYFFKEILEKINSILSFDSAKKYSGFVSKKNGEEFEIISGIGIFENQEGQCTPDNYLGDDYNSKDVNNGVFSDNKYKKYIKTGKGNEYFICLENDDDFDSVEKYLTKIFFLAVTVTLENVELIEFQNKIMTELRFEKEKVEMAENIKSEFMSNMSHELRTPMTGIMGCIDLIDDETNATIINALRVSSERLMQLIENMLKFSEVQKMEVKVSKEELNLVAIINRLNDSFRKKLESKGLELETNIDKKLDCTLLGDDLKIEQMLFNLYDNAVKFTKTGKISISVKEESRTENISFVEIAVTDTGIGIAKELHKQIFRPFVQGEYYLNKKFEGVGLGLSITKKIAKVLNGEITLESEEGKGSTFIIKLPISLKK